MVFMYYYLNQTNYPHVAYPTLTDIPELMRADSTVRSAGCGLCSASMVVTNLTGREFSLIDCLELSLEPGIYRLITTSPITARARTWTCWPLM